MVMGFIVELEIEEKARVWEASRCERLIVWKEFLWGNSDMKLEFSYLVGILVKQQKLGFSYLVGILVKQRLELYMNKLLNWRGLDMKSILRFLAQVSETKDVGFASMEYASSLSALHEHCFGYHFLLAEHRLRDYDKCALENIARELGFRLRIEKASSYDHWNSESSLHSSGHGPEVCGGGEGAAGVRAAVTEGERLLVKVLRLTAAEDNPGGGSKLG
ncbi:hypothetical protein Droror1_Dr00006994 [Drosera rotundifolia]